MMTNERERKVLLKAAEEIQQQQLSNTENLDRALLTLSSTGIALSVVLVRGLARTGGSHFWILWLSWALFLGAIFATLVSFLTRQSGLKTRRWSILKSILEQPKDPKLQKREMRLFGITTWLKYFSCFSYFGAILLTILFIVLNQKEIF